MIIERRSFLKGAAALFVMAPSIVRAESLMPVREFALPVPDWCPAGWLPLDGREIKKKFYPDLYAAYERMRFPMQLANDQHFTNYSGYSDPMDHLTSIPISPQFARIISARDLVRSNGSIARAGISQIISLPIMEN